MESNAKAVATAVNKATFHQLQKDQVRNRDTHENEQGIHTSVRTYFRPAYLQTRAE